MSDELDAVLKEYATLRDEILLWSRTELIAITVLFSLDTTLFGIILVKKIYLLLFIIPPINWLGVWLWLSDHCMIRILSAYISEKIEQKKLVEIIGTKSGELYIGWDSFVQNLPRQLRERGADRTFIVLALLWFNTILPLVLIYIYRENMHIIFDNFFHIFLGICVGLAIGLTLYILKLAYKKYSEIIKNYDYKLNR